MIEAMACGTPVIAFDEGSAPEVVRHGVGGLIVADVEAMARAVGEVAGIDRAGCRAWVAELCDPDGVASSYEDAYRAAIVRQSADSGGLRTR